MENPDDHERRKLKRRNLLYYLSVVNDNDQKVMGHLVDISMTGLMIDSRRPVPTQQEFNLRLDFSESIAKKTSISFVARSRWCRADSAQPFLYNVGLEITSISPNDAEIIREIAERYGAVDSSFSVTS